MKRTIALLLALVMAFALCGCGEVKKCEEAIDKIGLISSFSRNDGHRRYEDALAAYNTLTEEQKAKVKNVDLLNQKTVEYEEAEREIERKEFEEKVEEYVLEQVSKEIKEMLRTPSSFKLRTDKNSDVTIPLEVTPQTSEVTGWYSIYFSSTNAFGGVVDDEIKYDSFSFQNKDGKFSDFKTGPSFAIWFLDKW